MLGPLEVRLEGLRAGSQTYPAICSVLGWGFRSLKGKSDHSDTETFLSIGFKLDIVP